MSVAGLDPTYVIGGILKSSGSNANLGESDFLIAEADESDGSFLMLNPMISVITNIDKDHLENYNNSFLRLKKAYSQFANNLPFYGTCIVCGEDKNLSSIQKNIHRKIISYGFDSKNNLYAKDIEFSNSSMTFKVVSDHHETPFDVSLNLVGKHNVLNALAAVSIAFELGIDSEIVQTALNSFEGIARRLDSHGVVNINNSKVEVFDDYGHHPNEINAVLSALKETRKDKRLFVIFQPHRYTRTQILFNDFVKTLSKADQLILIDIYPASESPIENVSSEILANAIRQTSKLNPVVAKDIDEAFLLAENSIQDDDILLTLGAGNIYQLAKKLSQ
jgi:UDP-N-acetylmuramate--alanine ligase